MDGRSETNTPPTTSLWGVYNNQSISQSVNGRVDTVDQGLCSTDKNTKIIKSLKIMIIKSLNMFHGRLVTQVFPVIIYTYSNQNHISIGKVKSNPSLHTNTKLSNISGIFSFPPYCLMQRILQAMRKTTRLKSGWGFGQTNSPLSTARVLIDAVGLCLLRVSEVWRLFAPDLRRWINSFSGSDFKPRLVYKTWYFSYFVTNFNQQF